MTPSAGLSPRGGLVTASCRDSHLRRYGTHGFRGMGHLYLGGLQMQKRRPGPAALHAIGAGSARLIDRTVRGLLASRPRWFDRLVIRSVTAARARIRDVPRPSAPRVFYLERPRSSFPRKPLRAYACS